MQVPRRFRRPRPRQCDFDVFYIEALLDFLHEARRRDGEGRLGAVRRFLERAVELPERGVEAGCRHPCAAVIQRISVYGRRARGVWRAAA